MKNNCRTLRVTLWLMAVSLVFVNFVYAQDQKDDQREILEGFERIVKLLRLIEENYVEAVDSSALVEGAIRGVLGRLDPHSTYFTPEQTRRLITQQEGEYMGIGVTIGIRHGVMTVISPMEDGPAARQGIRTGDVITHIDGEPTENVDLEINARRLRGPEGTEVKVTIKRAGLNKPFTVSITRAKISLHTVPYFFLIDDKTGYIRLTHFSRTSSAEVGNAIGRLKDDGVEGLILDLRSNPGGDLIEAVNVADLFLDEGLIVYTMGSDPKSRKEYKASEKTTLWRGPVVVLIDRGSASSAEVVAGALQDQDRAILAGGNSWGKGLVQNIIPLPHDAALALTIARYYTPSGRLIQRAYTPGEFDEYYIPNEEVEEEQLTQARTSLGRVVYGGNGLAPDHEVDVPEPTVQSQEIILLGYVFDFVTRYLGEHPDLEKGFVADEGVMNQFKGFLDEKEYQVDAEDWKRDFDFLARRLMLETCTRLKGAEEGYRAIMSGDVQVQKAVDLMPEANELLHKRIDNGGD